MGASSHDQEVARE